IEVQDLELKLLSNDDLDDFDELDFDDDDLDFDDDEELKKAELDDLKVDKNSVFLDYLDFEGMDSLIDDTECDDELLDDE
ncbi:cell wall protein, partial [Vibrio parahaemolyticus]|uniref:hypothetical protein n=1 Tax=Vibrio parahaemolyticus TaxID=670 RepID=UPI00116C1676